MADIKASLQIPIISAILCNPEIRAWLTAQAKSTNAPIDDWMLRIVYLILGCPETT